MDEQNKARTPLQAEITGLKQHEAVLNGGVDSFRALVDAFPDAILWLQLDGRVADYRPASRGLSLFLTDDCRGQNISSVLPVSIAQQICVAAKRSVHEAQSQTLEFAQPQRLGDYLVGQGQINAAQLSAALDLQRAYRLRNEHRLLGEILAASGSLSQEALDDALAEQRLQGLLCDFEFRISASGPDQVLVIVRDISDHKRVEAALSAAYHEIQIVNDTLRRSRDLLRVLFDNLHDGLALVSHSGLVLAANAKLAQMFATPVEQLIGRHWDVNGKFVPALELPLSDNQERQIRARFTNNAGQKWMLDLHAMPVAGAHLPIEQVIIHVSDVSEQLQIEAQILEQERFAASGRLAATLAHEINTPLQALESCLHLVGQVEEARRADFLRIASQETHRIGSILHRLLELFEPQARTQSWIDLNELIGQVVLLNNAMLIDHGIRVELVLASNLPRLLGRADELSQVLLHIIVNAAQAMPKGGYLRLRTRLEPRSEAAVQDSGASTMIIEIEDTGEGMSAAVVAQIFEPFFTTRADSSGLGLTICNKIMAAHGGRIEVHTVPQAGTRFTLRFSAAGSD